MLAAGSGAGAAEEGDIVARGHALMQANCARCHAIAADDTSTHKEAPPFRVVVTKYPPEDLAEALAEGISSGHPDMPEFVFEPDDVAAIIAYLSSLTPADK
jgi:mono/diheme cytochrome c family protein